VGGWSGGLLPDTELLENFFDKNLKIKSWLAFCVIYFLLAPLTQPLYEISNLLLTIF
jgi:hypothetical protein